MTPAAESPTRLVPYTNTLIHAHHTRIRVNLDARALHQLVDAWHDWRAGRLGAPIQRIAIGVRRQSGLLHIDLAQIIAIEQPPLAAYDNSRFPRLAMESQTDDPDQEPSL